MMHMLVDDGGPGRKLEGAVMRRMSGGRVILLQGQGIGAGAVVPAAPQSLARRCELRVREQR